MENETPTLCQGCGNPGLLLTRMPQEQDGPGQPWLCRKCMEQQNGSAWVSSGADAMEIASLEGRPIEEVLAEANKEEIPQPDQDQATARVEQFFTELGSTMLNTVQEQQSLRSTLGQVIQERAEVVQIMERLVGQFAVISENQTKAADAIVSIGKVLQAMDQKIQLVMTLVDEHHKLFIGHGWARPLPKVDPLAN